MTPLQRLNDKPRGMDSACYAKSGNGRNLAVGDLPKKVGAGCLVVWAVVMFGMLAIGLVMKVFETGPAFVRSGLPQMIAQAVSDNFERLVLAGLLWVLVSTYLVTKRIAAQTEEQMKSLKEVEQLAKLRLLDLQDDPDFAIGVQDAGMAKRLDTNNHLLRQLLRAYGHEPEV